MKRADSYSFDRNYIVKASVAVVIKKIILTEIFLALIAFFLNFFVFSGGGDLIVTTSNTFYIGTFFLAINLIMFLYLLTGWNYTYYVISNDGISSNVGIIFRKTTSIDIPAIRSIIVKQGLFGKIFNYGTLTLESPLLSEKFYMYDLPNPFRHATLLEKARLKAINKGGAENVIIGK